MQNPNMTTQNLSKLTQCGTNTTNLNHFNSAIKNTLNHSKLKLITLISSSKLHQ